MGEDGKEELDANLLAARISAEGHKGPRPRRISEPSGDAEDISLLSPEEREKRRSFESKRKKHYNEFQAVKMARALMDEDEKSGGGEASSVAGGGGGGEGGSGTPMETGQ